MEMRFNQALSLASQDADGGKNTQNQSTNKIQNNCLKNILMYFETNSIDREKNETKHIKAFFCCEKHRDELDLNFMKNI